MGQGNSVPEQHEVPIEQISHQLALRFAEKCYSHLEIAHFRDNFKTLADHQDGLEYWKEETLCQFLSIPSSLHAGPVIYQMATYLGSFPFPSLAPCILTREAMLKVVTILTGKYRKVLKRGDQDKIKLLFRSMAVFDRRTSVLPEKASNPDNNEQAQTMPLSKSFKIDDAIDDADEEDEDEDDLALAALDALDAIEVFTQDQKREKRIGRAHIPADNLHRLFMLILLFASVTPQDNLPAYVDSLDATKQKLLADSAAALVNTFDPEPQGNAVSYHKFVTRIPLSLPYLFRPLNPLFEHFLFSKNIDLTKPAIPRDVPLKRSSPICLSAEDPRPAILNDYLLSQISLSLEIGPNASSATSSIFHTGARLIPLYSTATHGTSMSSFSRQVSSWRAATLLLVSGTAEDSSPILVGAFLPQHWSEKPDVTSKTESDSNAAMFQLLPRHAIFKANPYNTTTPLSHFSARTGISLGCILPTASRLQSSLQEVILGPVSLQIDEDISSATFQHDASAGTGAFLTDPGLEDCQRRSLGGTTPYQPKKTTFDVDAIEVWGVNLTGTGEDEVANQKKRLAWEEAEAAHRRGVNFGGDKDGARALLEMAGIVGDDAQNRSGGSV